MPLKYETKRRLQIKLPSGEQRELFLRGNMTVGEVLKRLGFSPDEHCLILNLKTLKPTKMLKEYEDIESAVSKVRLL